jgi:hypothetical protein
MPQNLASEAALEEHVRHHIWFLLTKLTKTTIWSAYSNKPVICPNSILNIEPSKKLHLGGAQGFQMICLYVVLVHQ